MRRVRHLWQRDSGSVLIFVAVSIFALAAMAILAIDISKLLVTRAQLQNAADAGALAGAELFLAPPPISSDDVDRRARDVAQMNKAFGADPNAPLANVSDVAVTAVTDLGSPDYGTVTVTARSIVAQYFTRVAGAPQTGGVAATAAARAGEVCRTKCLKPWSIPDRWDDTGQPGWPKWAGDKYWNTEKFTDLNGDRLWNPGEPFLDGDDGSKKGGPMDGKYTSEYYDPVRTGYLASKDLGVAMTFKVANPHDASQSGQFYPIDLCLGPDGTNPCTGGDVYRENIGKCNPNFYGPGDWVPTENGNMIGPTKQGLEDLIAQDPNASWDDNCKCVKNSAFGNDSPRIIFIPLHDPRIPLDSGKMEIRIVKIIAAFIEDQKPNGDVVARFMKVQAQGQLCPPGSPGGGYVFNLSLVR